MQTSYEQTEGPAAAARRRKRHTIKDFDKIQDESMVSFDAGTDAGTELKNQMKRQEK